MLENILTHPSSRSTAVDIFTGDLERIFTANLEMSGLRDRVAILKGESQHVLRRLPLDSFDIVYIDGGHSAKNVYMDAALSWDLLKPNGTLIFDDYLWDLRLPSNLRPKISIDAFLVSFGDELKVVHNGYQLAIKKEGNPCDRFPCSTIGDYGYDWREGVLYELPHYKQVKLTDIERRRL